MKYCLQSLLCIFALVVAPGSFAATDLFAAWQSAKIHDAEFASEEAEWRAGLTRKRQGRALLLPQVQATAGVGRATQASTTSGARFLAPSFGPPGNVDFDTSIDNGDSSRWAVSARQPLYDAEKFASYSQAQRQVELAELKYRLAQQQLILRVAQVYFDCVRSEQRLNTLQAMKKTTASARDEAEARFRAGDTPITDRDDAQARFDFIVAEELAAHSDVAEKRSAFAAVTGIDAIDILAVTMQASPTTEALDIWQARALAQNPMIAMRQAGIEIAQAEVDKYRALTSPKLDLVAQVGEDRLDGRGDFGNSHINSSGWVVGVQLNVPLFSGGMRSAKRDEAAAHVEQSRFDLDAVRALVKRQTESAWLGVNTGTARVRALQKAQASADRRLQSTRLGHRVGARTTLDQLNAEADFFSVQSALTEARCDLLMSYLQLDATAGVLDEGSLQRINTVASQDTASMPYVAPMPAATAGQ